MERLLQWFACVFRYDFGTFLLCTFELWIELCAVRQIQYMQGYGLDAVWLYAMLFASPFSQFFTF